jgi:hypothetical protein
VRVFDSKINKEAVKTLVVAYGQREAARRAGLSENTVKSWCLRYGWQQANSSHPNRTQGPGDALKTQLELDSEASKIGFSKASRKAAENLATKSPRTLLDKDTAQAAKHWHGIASGTHGWEEKQQQAQVMVNIALLGIDPQSVQVQGCAAARTIDLPEGSGIDEPTA